MRLDLDLAGAMLSFTSPLTGGPFPWLVSVGATRIAARAGTPTGIAVGEAPSVEVALDNSGRQASRVVDVPLRRRATIYDDAGEVYFDGTVAEVAVGRSLVLTIEA